MRNNYQTLKHELKNHILTIWLNRPDVHNAFNKTMLNELVDILGWIKNSDEVRVVIFSGEGKSFSAGADLNWMREIINCTYEENLQDSEMISKIFYLIYTCPKPVITAINGAAIGGGMGFVGASDIVIASDQARFSLSEVRIGMVPSCISPYLFKKVGEGVLKELFILGQRFDAAKALRINLINYVVEPERLLEFAQEKAKELLVCGPNAISICKKLFHEVSEMDLLTAYNYTAELIAKMRISDEAQEGMKAFLEKRKPNWQPDI